MDHAAHQAHEPALEQNGHVENEATVIVDNHVAVYDTATIAARHANHVTLDVNRDRSHATGPARRKEAGPGVVASQAWGQGAIGWPVVFANHDHVSTAKVAVACSVIVVVVAAIASVVRISVAGLVAPIVARVVAGGAIIAIAAAPTLVGVCRTTQHGADGHNSGRK